MKSQEMKSENKEEEEALKNDCFHIPLNIHIAIFLTDITWEKREENTVIKNRERKKNEREKMFGKWKKCLEKKKTREKIVETVARMGQDDEDGQWQETG